MRRGVGDTGAASIRVRPHARSAISSPDPDLWRRTPHKKTGQYVRVQERTRSARPLLPGFPGICGSLVNTNAFI